MKERIIKDYDNMGMRCNYTVQMYLEGKKKWVYKKTYNAKGFNPHMPKWYSSRAEAEKLFDPDSERCPDATLGVDDKESPVISFKPAKILKEVEVLEDIQKIMRSIELYKNPLWNDAGGSTFFGDIYNDLEKIETKLKKGVERLSSYAEKK